MDTNPDPFGREATQPLSIPSRGWWQVAERVYTESVRSQVACTGREVYGEETQDLSNLFGVLRSGRRGTIYESRCGSLGL